MALGIAPGSTLVIATHNAGKVREMNDLLAPFDLKALPASHFNLPEPEETGLTFAANSELKALATMQATGLPSLADDSGLAVEALGGDPGIYSARWAGPTKDFTIAMERIRQELLAKSVPEADWRAVFICDLCLALPNGAAHHFEGRVEGRLTFPPRGENGFGYDPIFVPEGHNTTFAQMALAAKQQLSHRGRAFALLAASL